MSVLDRLIEGFFNSIRKSRRRQFERWAARDPEMKKIQEDMEKNRQALQDWIETRREEDPEFRAASDAVREFHRLTNLHD